MDTNKNQPLPTLDSAIMNLDNSSNLQGLGQQITINENEKEISNPKNEELSSNPPVQDKESETMDKIEIVEEPKEEEKKEKESKSYIDKLLCIFAFIRPYFKVTFNDIKIRLISSFLPINNSFFNIAVDHPDLYGPFWIYTTLIYVIAAGGALSYYFTNSVNNYFQAFVPVAGTILYLYGFGFPLVMWLSMKCFKLEMKYVSLICLYGYSLTCFIPVLIICSSGFAWIQWIFLLYGIINSTAFVLINLWNYIRSLEEKNKYIFLGIFGCGQFILFLILKLYFFGSFNNKINNGTETNIPNNVK